MTHTHVSPKGKRFVYLLVFYWKCYPRQKI